MERREKNAQFYVDRLKEGKGMALVTKGTHILLSLSLFLVVQFI